MFFSRLIKPLKPRRVDTFLYELNTTSFSPQSFVEEPLSVEKREDENRIHYIAYFDGHVAHRATLFLRVRLPAQFGYGHHPVIGDCVTDPAFRGRKLYPHMLNFIVQDAYATMGTPIVQILVAHDNLASIRGIERAGFTRIARLRGIRLGPFVLNRKRA
ncbi:MAG: GNAT family N-acetyltransferase [Anaerolineae bacterium]|nr:GNAT family N-acetyltransferase [Anaerolineae bacterium]